MVSFFSALEMTLRDLNQPVEPGVAISAMVRSYAEATQQQTTRAPARTAPRPASDAVATTRR